MFNPPYESDDDDDNEDYYFSDPMKLKESSICNSRSQYKSNNPDDNDKSIPIEILDSSSDDNCDDNDDDDDDGDGDDDDENIKPINLFKDNHKPTLRKRKHKAEEQDIIELD